MRRGMLHGLILALGLMAGAAGAERTEPPTRVKALILRVTGGDTLEAAPLAPQRVRLAGLEARGEGTQKFLAGLLPVGSVVTLDVRGRDGAGLVADVVLPDGRSVGRILLDAGRAQHRKEINRP